MDTGFRVGAVRRSAGFTVTEASVPLFAAISLDFSRVHTDAAYAARGLFGRRVGHGLLGLCLAEGLLSRSPGPAGVAFAWAWEFRAPFFASDTLCAEAVVEAAATQGGMTVATESVSVLNQHRAEIQRGRRRLALPADDAPPAWLEAALRGPGPGFEDVRVVEAEAPPPSTTPPEFADETGVFFEDLAVGDRFRTPAYTVGEYEADGFLGLTGESGPWFRAGSIARAAGLPGRPVAPLYGLALVEGLKYALAPDAGVGIPIASLSWRWRQTAPVHIGDTLFLEVEITGKRASQTKTDRGVVAQAISLVADGRGVVQRGQHLQMFRRRVAAAHG